MLGRGIGLAIGAALSVGSGPFLLDGSSPYGHARRRRRRAVFNTAMEDLSARETPPLAPEKPLTKRQKRRLRGKRNA